MGKGLFQVLIAFQKVIQIKVELREGACNLPEVNRSFQALTYTPKATL